jgi:hypothetical protein
MTDKRATRARCQTWEPRFGHETAMFQFMTNIRCNDGLSKIGWAGMTVSTMILDPRLKGSGFRGPDSPRAPLL